jgi:hypothetical protein
MTVMTPFSDISYHDKHDNLSSDLLFQEDEQTDSASERQQGDSASEREGGSDEETDSASEKDVGFDEETDSASESVDRRALVPVDPVDPLTPIQAPSFL